MKTLVVLMSLVVAALCTPPFPYGVGSGSYSYMSRPFGYSSYMSRPFGYSSYMSRPYGYSQMGGPYNMGFSGGFNMGGPSMFMGGSSMYMGGPSMYMGGPSMYMGGSSMYAPMGFSTGGYNFGSSMYYPGNKMGPFYGSYHMPGYKKGYY